MRLPPFSEATFGEDQVRGKTRPAKLFLEHKGEVLWMVSKFSAQNPALHGSLTAEDGSDYAELYLLLDAEEALSTDLVTNIGTYLTLER